MTDREIVEYYYTYILTDRDWYCNERGCYYKSSDDTMYYEHSGSDIHLYMKYECEAHMEEMARIKKRQEIIDKL